jgi:hypothetical protein
VLIQALLSPGRELIGGSKNLNCRWIFGFAKLIVESESVGSAERVSDPEGNVMRNHAERSSDQAAEKWHKDSKRLSEKHGVMLKKARVQSPTADGFESASKKVYGSAHIDPDCGTYLTKPEHSEYLLG